MKKWIALLCVLALGAGLLIYNSLARPCCDCAPTEPSATEPSHPSVPTDPSTEPSVEPSTDPSVSEPPQTQPSEPTPGLTQVRLQVSNPARWRALEGEYPQLGIAVVITDENPTMVILEEVGAVQAQHSAWVDLSGTAAYAQLINWDLAAKYEGQVFGLPLEMECFGLISNNPLMASLGATTGDISDFATLSQVAANLSGQGVPAFATMKTETLCQLMMMIPEHLRGFLDLYLANTKALSLETSSSLDHVLNQNAVLCLTSGTELAQLNEDQLHQLGYLPLYLGGENEANTSVYVTGKSFACVRADASTQEQEAAVALLNYLVTAQEDGSVPADALKLGAPYRQATFCANPFQELLRADLLTGKTCVYCPCVSEIPETLIQAMEIYLQDPTDENWSAILMAPAPIM